MSGSLVGGAAGAILGSLSGGVSIMVGLGIGQVLGSLWDATRVQRYDQGKLSDRRVSGSAYGSDVPRIWGKGKVGVNCVWFAKDSSGNHLKKHKKRKRSGGKGVGGSEVTTYYYTCSLAGLAMEASIYFPATETFSHRNPVLKKLWANDVLVFDDDAADNTVEPVWHDGTETQSPDSVIVAADGTSSGDTVAFRGKGYFTIEDFNLSDYGNSPPQLTAYIETDAVTLADIVSDICQSLGILTSELDVTAGAGTSVEGFVWTNRQSGVDALEMILLAYDFDLSEVDGKLVLVARSSASTFSVTHEDLGAGGGVLLEQSFSGEADLPSRVDVKFLDLNNQLQQGMMTEARQTAEVPRIDTIELPLVLAAGSARNIAARRLDAAWLENRTLKFNLPPRFLEIAPGDKGDVEYLGTTYRVRVLKTMLNPEGTIGVEAVFQSVEVLTQDGAGGVDPDPDDTAAIIPAEWVVWSGRDLSDDHRGQAGFYVAAAAAAGWRGATVYYSVDSGVNWIEGPPVTGETIFGETVGTLSASGAVADTFDGTNTVEVDVTASIVALLDFPATTTADNVRAGDNQALIGQEIVGFQTVTPSGTNEFTLEDLLRGQRASTMSGHAAGDLFVVLTDDVVFVPVSSDLIGDTLDVKLVSGGQVLGDVTAQTVTIATPRATEIDEVKASALIPYMVAPVVAASSATPGTRTAVGWTTYDASGDLDSGTAFAYLQAVGVDGGDTGAGLQAIEVRKDSGGPVFVAIEGTILNNDGDLALCSTILVPVTSSRTFDYRVLVGFQDDWELRVLGGFKPLT